MHFILFLVCFSFLIKWNLADNTPVIQKLPGSSNVIAGQKIKISCALTSGSIPITFYWYKNDQQLVSGKQIQIKSLEEDNSVLVINQIRPQDSGEYKCIAKNRIGSDQINVKVTVQGMNMNPLLVPMKIM